MKKTASVVGAIFGVSILCIGFLAIVSPHYAYDPQKYVYVGRYIGELFGGALFLTIVGIIAAGITALIKRRDPYKASTSAKAGMVFVVIITLLIWGGTYQ